MAYTVANELKAAGLTGICAVFNSGDVRLTNSGATQVGIATFGATAFGTPTTASPSVATANALTPGACTASATIANIDFRTSGGASRLSGTVGITGSGADYIISDPVIPSGMTTITIPSLQFTLQITG
jgi:hypothetical protein